jgi:isopentenyldiphosphate isomerase
MAVDEIFDVVDLNDEVVGHKFRGEIHALGLMHRAVHVLLFNQRGEVFLQKRSMLKDTSPGLWDSSVSGHVDRGESYDVCAIRETEEELGYQVEKGKLRQIFKLSPCDATGQEFIWVYQAEAEGPFKLHPDEIESGEWFSKKRITDNIRTVKTEFSAAFRLVWEKFVEQEGGV